MSLDKTHWYTRRLSRTLRISTKYHRPSEWAKENEDTNENHLCEFIAILSKLTFACALIWCVFVGNAFCICTLCDKPNKFVSPFSISAEKKNIKMSMCKWKFKIETPNNEEKRNVKTCFEAQKNAINSFVLGCFFIFYFVHFVRLIVEFSFWVCRRRMEVHIYQSETREERKRRQMKWNQF